MQYNLLAMKLYYVPLSYIVCTRKTMTIKLWVWHQNHPVSCITTVRKTCKFPQGGFMLVIIKYVSIGKSQIAPDKLLKQTSIYSLLNFPVFFVWIFHVLLTYIRTLSLWHQRKYSIFMHTCTQQQLFYQRKKSEKENTPSKISSRNLTYFIRCGAYTGSPGPHFTINSTPKIITSLDLFNVKFSYE